MSFSPTQDLTAPEPPPPAAIWRRVVAFGADLVILAPALVLLAWCWQHLFAIHLPSQRLPWFDWVIQLHLQDDPLVAGGWLALGAVAAAYFFVGHLLTGTSPGMRLLHLGVVDRLGQRPGPAAAGTRVLGAALAAAYLGLGFLWILFDARRQGLHDKIAGTYVVRRNGR